jgi:hypothetical protein
MAAFSCEKNKAINPNRYNVENIKKMHMNGSMRNKLYSPTHIGSQAIVPVEEKQQTTNNKQQTANNKQQTTNKCETVCKTIVIE